MTTTMNRAVCTVFVFVFAMLCLSSASAHAGNRHAIKEMIVFEAQQNGLKPSLALAVAKIESDFQARALSSAGARGVMQIMPATAWGEYQVGANRLWDARTNIRLGIDFLANLIKRYGGRWDLALSHYNGGTIKNDRPHSYTRGYVSKVLTWEKRYADQHEIWTVTADATPTRKAPPVSDLKTFNEYLGGDFYNNFKRARDKQIAMAKLQDELMRRQAGQLAGHRAKANAQIQNQRQSWRQFAMAAPMVSVPIRRPDVKILGPIVRWSR